MKARFISFICVVFFLFSCEDSLTKVNLIEKKEIRITNLLNPQYSFPVGSSVKENMLVLQDVYDMSSLICFDLDSSQSIIEGRALPSFNNLRFHKLYYKNKDSIFGFNDTTRNLQILKGLELSSSDSLSACSNLQMPLRGDDTFIAMPYNPSGFRDLQEVYESAPILLYNYKNSIAKPIGIYPQAYVSDTKDYYDCSPKVSFNEKGLVYAFGADHYIYSYEEGEGFKTFKAKSKYVKYFREYPEDKAFDLVYLKKYNYEEPRYLDVIYDPFRQLYYRIVKHRSKYKRGEGMLPSNWSVIVLDKNMEKIGEVLFDNPLYSTQIIAPAKGGLYIHKNYSDGASVVPGEKKLALFDIVYE